MPIDHQSTGLPENKTEYNNQDKKSYPKTWKALIKKPQTRIVATPFH